MPQWLSVSAVSSGPCLVVAVAGEADVLTAGQLREELTQALAYGPRSVMLDLADLSFCNLHGLRALNDFCDVAQQASVDVSVRGMPRQLGRLVDTLDSVLAGGQGVRSWARRPLLRADPGTSTGLGRSWESRETN
jgi:anti-anti-sigma factor